MHRSTTVESLDALPARRPARVIATDALWPPTIPREVSRVGSRILLAVAVIVLAATAGLYWVRATYEDRIYPGINAGGVPVGGMTYAEAREAIAARAESFEATTATFTFEDKIWQPTLNEIGVHVDVEGTVDSAFAIGREDDARSRLQVAWSLLREDKSVPLRVSVDAAQLNAWFDRVDADLGIAPKDANLVVNGTEVSIDPEVAGTIVDRERLTQQLMDSLRNMSAPSGDLPVIPKWPTVHAKDLEPAKQKLEQALSKPIRLTHDGKSWTIDPADLSQFVVTKVTEQPGAAPQVDVSLDEKKLTKWLSQRFRGEIDRDPVDARVAWNGERVFALEDSKDGYKLKPTSLAKEISKSFFGNHETVRVPVAVIKPRVDSNNLEALGITTRLAVGTSNFDGSNEGRAENIRVGTELLNGTLVPPGEVFSFNHAIGVISAEAGFVEAPVVDGERIGRDVGGGICQVSTTVFRASLYAGLPTEEWWPHRYRFAFYEYDGWTPGLDASILQPEGDPFGGGDFKFRNNTDGWLLIESYIDWPRVVVIIYGPDTGWDVQISEPIYGEEYPEEEDIEIVDKELEPGTIMQTEYAQKGLDVTYIREVRDRNGEVILRDEYSTHFYPRGNVWKVSEDMRGKSPAGKKAAD